MKKEILGKCMLLMSALIWGSSFIVMKNAVDFISPFTLLCIRFVLSTIFISILFFNKIKKIKKQDLLGGFLAGLALFSAFSIQTFGLQLTTPGKNAFLTAVYCTIVPLLSWLYFKKKPDKAQIFAAILCFIGVGFVSLDSSLKVNLGDLYTLIGGFLYAVHIIVCEKAMKKTSPIIITALQFAFASIFSFIAASLFEDISVVFHIDSSIYLQILYLAFLLYKTCPVSLSMTIPYCPTILTSSPSAKTGTNDVKIIINDKVIVNNFLIIVFLPPYVKKITLFLISKPK